MKRMRKSGEQNDLLAQEAARLAEIRGYEQKTAGEAVGETVEEMSSRRFPLKIVIPIVVLLVVLAIGIPVAMSLWSNPAATDLGPAGVVKAASRIPALPEIDEGAVSNLSGEGTARAFLEAESWEARMEFVRDAEEVDGHRERYPEEVTGFPVEVAELRPMGIVSSDGLLTYERFMVRMPSGGKRILCVVHTEVGGRVDYDAFARYASGSWEDLQAGRRISEVRLMAARDTYYNKSFRDDSKLDCFKLASPDWPKAVWGYVPKNSITAKLLSQIVSSRGQRVTLALRSENESHLDSQFAIERVIINGWVRTPLDPEDSLRMKLGR